MQAKDKFSERLPPWEINHGKSYDCQTPQPMKDVALTPLKNLVGFRKSVKTTSLSKVFVWPALAMDSVRTFVLHSLMDLYWSFCGWYEFRGVRFSNLLQHFWGSSGMFQHNWQEQINETKPWKHKINARFGNEQSVDSQRSEPAAHHQVTRSLLWCRKLHMPMLTVPRQNLTVQLSLWECIWLLTVLGLHFKVHGS